MKRFLTAITLVAALILTACSGPKTIPDDKLEAIIYDIMLSNAYCMMDRGMGQSDSVDIYTPVFDKYGYTKEDFLFTIGSFSKRKSVRLTDVIDNVTQKLQTDGGVYFSQAAKVKTSDSLLAEQYKKEVFFKASIHRNKPSDTPDIKIPISPGRYVIEYTYKIDTADKNTYIQYTHNTKDTAGRKGNYLYRSYMKGEPTIEKLDVEYKQDFLDSLEIRFVYMPNAPKATTNVTIDSIRITHYIPKEAARDSLMLRISYPKEKWVPQTKNQNNNGKRTDPKDFVTLRPDSTGVSVKRDSIVR